MATYFGFDPTNNSKFYFVSYNTEDGDRVAAVCRCLHAAGVPLWYDADLKHGDAWSTKIMSRISKCREFVFFLTRGIIDKANQRLAGLDPESDAYKEAMDGLYVWKEYRAAKFHQKKKLIVYMDQIDKAAVPVGLMDTWVEDFYGPTQLQGVEAFSMSSPQEIALAILKELGYKPKQNPDQPEQKKQPGAQAQANVSKRIFEQGRTCLKNGNNEQAVECFTKAAEQGHAEAQFQLGLCYKKGVGASQDDARAVRWFAKAAANGHAEAQYHLGLCCETGTGTDKDAAKAVHCFTKAAEQGHAAAQFCLGQCCRKGSGTKKDPVKAVYWYEKAAEQGYEKAQCNLAFCYETGLGTGQNPVNALHWYTKAAEQGDAFAQYTVGKYFAHGTGVSKDAVKAVFWYTKAAEQGNAMAQYAIGKHYADGTGVSKDTVKAVYWFTRAAEQGQASAQYKLGNCYYGGIGVNRDLAKAIYWDAKAAEQGHAMAQYYLGFFYENGMGTDRDIAKAMHWYAKAAEQGVSDAQNSLDRCRQAEKQRDAAEQQRKAEEAAAEERLRKEKEKRAAEQKRRAEEAARAAEQKRRAEQQAAAERNRKAREQREAEQKQREEQQRLAAEQKRKEEEERKKSEQADKRRDQFSLAVWVIIGLVLLMKFLIMPFLDELRFDKAYSAQKENLSSLTVGSTVKFGLYDMDGSIFNGKEEIEWQVLDVDGSKALLISKYALADKPYHKQKEAVTWEACSLRKWLNDKFYQKAFGEDHKRRINVTKVIADKNPQYDTLTGSVTNDTVFLLSINEAEKYFKTNESRECKMAKYANESTDYSYHNAEWWLRTTGKDLECAAYVDSCGSIRNSGEDVNEYDQVRPAIWINFDS